jgi:hypothetical protein
LVLSKGRFPADVRAELERERIVLIAEGIPGRVTRHPGASRKSGTIAALAITQQRLVLYGMGQPLLDVTWDSGDAREIELTTQEDGLDLAFDAERLSEDGSGRVELFLRIADAAALVAAIEQRRRPLERRERRRDEA